VGGGHAKGLAPVVNLQQQTAATTARPGVCGCAYSRLARRECHSTRPAPPLCKQWRHSIMANSDSDVACPIRAQTLRNCGHSRLAMVSTFPLHVMNRLARKPPVSSFKLVLRIRVMLLL
jgi:hypothetical protein